VIAVFPSDVIVGDDGVMNREIADEVADECIKMTLYEDFFWSKLLMVSPYRFCILRRMKVI
jgi:regulator of RNase E activity RraA